MSLKNKIFIACCILLAALLTKIVHYGIKHPSPTAAHQLYVAQNASVRAVQLLYGQRATSVYCHAPRDGDDRCGQAFNSNGAYCHPRWQWMPRDIRFCCDTRDGASNGGCYIAP